jgi:hypothetical protein
VATTADDVVPKYADLCERIAGRKNQESADANRAEMEAVAKPKKNTSMQVGYRKKMVRVYLGRLLRDLEAGASLD